MSDELKNENALTVQQAPTAGNYLAMIAKAAADPNTDVAKFHGLLDIQERILARQAETDFNNAMGDLQQELPRIKKDGKIIHRDKQSGKETIIATFAKFETIDDVVRPLMKKHGFSIRFDAPKVDGSICVSATLSHTGGHKITSSIPLAIDSSGAKNNVQGVGSTISYGKRYLLQMMLNLVFEGQDDDGQMAAFVAMTDEQSAKLKDLLRETNADIARFLRAYGGAASVDEMDSRYYLEAFNTLMTKKTRMSATP